MRTKIAAIVLVGLQTTYYVAKVTSFGCSSIEAAHHLQELRSDQKAFQERLMEKQMSGECVARWCRVRSRAMIKPYCE